MVVPVLSIANLRKVYPGGKVGIDDLTLDINPGDLYGFIGHNGAGKTTTLRCVSGILPFDSGTVRVAGVNLADDIIGAKRVTGYIPDTPELYGHLTGTQYLSFISSVFELDAAHRESALQFAADFEISDDLPLQINSYSHGMKQKLALVSTFMRDPKLLLLDEPFSGLDPKASLTLRRLLTESCDRGSAVFFSTHVLEVAEKICTRVAVIKSGRLVAHGLTSDIVGADSLTDVFMELTETVEPAK